MFGVPDDDCGEVPNVAIVMREPLTGEEVTAFVKGQVARCKRLYHVVFADAIPKSPSGKILCRRLTS